MHIAVPAYAAHILHLLSDAGYESFVVGGCVRDSLLGRVPDDWDITTCALPAETIAALDGIRTLETGIKHGTVTALIEGKTVEITTYRVDGRYSDNRRPDSVSFTRSLREDLARRDFTVNALAYSSATGVIDYFGGINDLRDRILRCVGNPDLRFQEDALRIMRALRFAATLGFSIELQTAQSLRRNCALLEQIAAERLGSELVRLLCGSHAFEIFCGFPEVIQRLIPALPACPAAFTRVEPNPILRLTMLLLPLSPENADAALARLRYDNATRRAVTTLLTHHTASIEPVKPVIRRWLNRLGEPLLRDLLAIQSACGEDLLTVQMLLDEMISANDCWTLRMLAVNGDDLLAAGIPAGKPLGEMLHELLDAVMDDKLPNERDVLLQKIKRPQN